MACYIHMYLHTVPYTLSPTFYTLNPTFYTLSPIFYTLSPTFYILSPIFYTLSPTFYTLSPTFYTLSSTFYTSIRPLQRSQQQDPIITSLVLLLLIGFAATIGFGQSLFVWCNCSGHLVWLIELHIGSIYLNFHTQT